MPKSYKYRPIKKFITNALVSYTSCYHFGLIHTKMEENIKELKKLFDATKKATKKAKETSSSLDKKIDEIFGFNYSETDNDEMIDTLDYGTNDISFKHFFELMTYYKNERGFGSLDEAE